jgi:hypothetical protein
MKIVENTLPGPGSYVPELSWTKGPRTVFGKSERDPKRKVVNAGAHTYLSEGTERKGFTNFGSV